MSPQYDAQNVLILLDRSDGILLVKMPYSVKIFYKTSRANPLDIVATFNDDEWWNLENDWRNFSNNENNPKRAYKCVLHQRGDEIFDSTDERPILLDLKEIRAIV